MKKSVLGILFAALGLAGCTPIAGKPYGVGSIYSEVHFNERATDAPMGAKRGESCATGILGLIATGDASAATAAKQAGIGRIATVDAMNSNILGIYSKYCVVVTGE